LKLLVPDPCPCIQIEWSNLTGRVGEEVMNLETAEVESSTAQPPQDVEPLEAATDPQVRKRNEFVKGETCGTVRLSS